MNKERRQAGCSIIHNPPYACPITDVFSGSLQIAFVSWEQSPQPFRLERAPEVARRLFCRVFPGARGADLGVCVCEPQREAGHSHFASFLQESYTRQPACSLTDSALSHPASTAWLRVSLLDLA